MPTLIAVVDDDPEFVELMHDVLEAEGFQVLGISQGGDAHPRLRAAKPNLILLDIWMEHRDAGWKVLDCVHHDPDLANTPLIVASASEHDLQDRAADLQSLRVEVLLKPFHFTTLVGLVRRLLDPAA
jgi:CheY-like chemotaxis protein